MDFNPFSKPLGFKPNITPVDVIENQIFNQRFKKYAFGGTYFIDIYSNVNNKWYKNSWKGI